VLRKVLISVLFAFGALALQAQPAPTPAQQELAKPLQLEDGKAAQGQGADTPGPSVWSAFGSLLVVLGLALGGLHLLKKYGRKHLPGSGGGKLKVAETLALGDRRYVSILEADGERFLIALHPQGISLLARLDGLDVPADFAAQLHQAETQAPIPLKELEARIRNQEGAE
jgi:flagellar biogenesis protein FliO